MKITREQFKTIVKEVMTEENEYQAFFQKALDKAGKSIPSMSDEEKKAFFDKIDAAWNGKGEKNEELVGGQKELDVDGDGDISGDDLADLRAGKKADESVNEIQYKDAIQKFNDELIKHPMVKKVAQHYKKTPAEIVKVLQQRLSTKGNRGGDTKEVSVDFKDTDSGITIKHKKMFNESVNEEEIKWNAVENAIINFLKMNTKILDKRVKDKDTDGVKGGLQSIIDGLTNAQRSLKLK
jgi:hypothetical protein